MSQPAYDDLIAAHRGRADRRTGTVERVEGTAGRLVYNPCLIPDGDRSYVAVRVESPSSYWRDESSWDPAVRIVERAGDVWVDVPGTPVFEAAEDPFAAWMTDRSGHPVLVFGVVSLDFGQDPPGVVSRFYAASDVHSLHPPEPFLEVPGMKDIRLLQLEDGVAVCGRPQGGEAGVGRISLAMIDNYADLTPEVLRTAHVFVDQVAPQTKLGSNALYDLGDRIGVLGHVAVGAEGDHQRYAAACWTIDRHAMTAEPPRIIAERADFPAAPVKLDVLSDVVFPGALEPLGDGTARLYSGLSDAALGSIVVPAPW